MTFGNTLLNATSISRMIFIVNFLLLIALSRDPTMVYKALSTELLLLKNCCVFENGVNLNKKMKYYTKSTNGNNLLFRRIKHFTINKHKFNFLVRSCLKCFYNSILNCNGQQQMACVYCSKVKILFLERFINCMYLLFCQAQAGNLQTVPVSMLPFFFLELLLYDMEAY